MQVKVDGYTMHVTADEYVLIHDALRFATTEGIGLLRFNTARYASLMEQMVFENSAALSDIDSSENYHEDE
jgi:hypothetical protein